MHLRTVITVIFAAFVSFPLVGHSLPPPPTHLTFDVIAKGDQFDKLNQSAYLFNNKDEFSQIETIVETTALNVDFNNNQVFAFFANWRGDCSQQLNITDVIEYSSSIEFVIEKSFTKNVNCTDVVTTGYLYEIVSFERKHNMPFAVKINTVVTTLP